MFIAQSTSASTLAAQIQNQFIRLPEVMKMTGYARSSILNKSKDGTMPSAIKLGPRAVAWVKSDIQEWIDGRIAAARGVQ